MTGKKVTIKDVAEAVGVSTALVSFALNGRDSRYRVSEEMRKRIIEKAKEFNYQPNNAARSLRCGKTATIGVILADISNIFFADIARRIEDEAAKAGYTTIFGSTDDDVNKLEKLVDIFMNKSVEGFIIVPCDGSETVISKLIEINMPLVLIDRTYKELNVSSVTLDNLKATSLAVEDLYTQGFRKISFISYITAHSNILDRKLGYIRTMEKLGLEAEISVKEIDYREKQKHLQELIPQMLEEGTEAIIFVTNRLAIDGLVVLRNINKTVPDDVAVVAFDGSETFAFDLYYTTVSYIKQPIDKFGIESFSLLKKLIANGNSDLSTRIILNPEMISLDSSKKK